MTIPEQLAQALADLAASNQALAAERVAVTTFTSQLAELTANNKTLSVDLETARSSVSALGGQVASLGSEVVTLKAAAKTATEQATEMAARIGVSPVAAASGTGSEIAADMTLDEVRAALSKTTDSRERGRLTMLSRKIRGLQ